MPFFTQPTIDRSVLAISSASGAPNVPPAFVQGLRREALLSERVCSWSRCRPREGGPGPAVEVQRRGFHRGVPERSATDGSEDSLGKVGGEVVEGGVVGGCSTCSADHTAVSFQYGARGKSGAIRPTAISRRPGRRQAEHFTANGCPQAWMADAGQDWSAEFKGWESDPQAVVDEWTACEMNRNRRFYGLPMDSSYPSHTAPSRLSAR